MENSLTALQRIEALFDEGSFKQTDAVNNAGVITGYGDIFGLHAFAFSQDKSVCDGAVSMAHAEKISKLYELAAKAGAPVIGIYDSFGAKLDEGVQVLDAYGRIAKKAAEISGVVPQISYIAGACLGVSASIAQMADFIIMSKNGELFVNPPSSDFEKENGNAQAVTKRGLASLVCDTEEEAINKIKMIVSSFPENNLSAIPQFEYDYPSENNFTDVEKSAASIADKDSLLELWNQYGNGAYTAIGKVLGSTVGFIGASGKLSCTACGKITKFASICDAFSIPVVSIIDCDGIENESKSAARLINAFATASTANVCIITGKAIGAAYIAFCSASDMLYAFDNAVTAPLLPETAEGFLNISADEYSLQNLASKNNAVTEIINSASARQTVESALDILSGKRVSSLPKKHSNLPY